MHATRAFVRILRSDAHLVTRLSEIGHTCERGSRGDFGREPDQRSPDVHLAEGRPGPRDRRLTTSLAAPHPRPPEPACSEQRSASEGAVPSLYIDGQWVASADGT